MTSKKTQEEIEAEANTRAMAVLRAPTRAHRAPRPSRTEAQIAEEQTISQILSGNTQARMDEPLGYYGTTHPARQTIRRTNITMGALQEIGLDSIPAHPSATSIAAPPIIAPPPPPPAQLAVQMLDQAPLDAGNKK